MKRVHTIAIMLTLAVAMPVLRAGDPPAQSDTAEALHDAFNPTAVAGSAVGAAFTQATNTPSEWGQGAEGYGRRVGSGFATHLLKVGIAYPLARVFHEEFRYRPSGKHGFRPRLMYALVSTVYVRRTGTNRRTLSRHEFASTIGSGLLSRLWQPASTRAAWHGFVSGGIAIAADAGVNVLREFWPDIRHRHRLKPAPAPVP